MQFRLFNILPLFIICYAFLTNQIKYDAQTGDGPYVLYKNGKVYAKYIIESNGTKTIRVDSAVLRNKEDLVLKVSGDEPGDSFSVKLKKELDDEKAEYKDVKKMFILSDIEGNFRAFRRLLMSNNVIDSNYDWVFGDGHLVLIGDFFDRGAHVAETLWLIYSLEEKAKAAGGYVHFILGNHEIMNLNGDTRYVNKKYFENALLMKESYIGLYNEKSELGKWLRTKNIAEKVGNILFIHAGISPEVNALDLPLKKMNKLVKASFGDTTDDYPDTKTELLYGNKGPFWYRGYYKNENLQDSQLDSTMLLYNVKHIATGHSIIADTISILKKGKLINTDVHHAKGHSEALLVEGNKFYRADGIGQKFLVWEK